MGKIFPSEGGVIHKAVRGLPSFYHELADCRTLFWEKPKIALPWA